MNAISEIKLKYNLTCIVWNINLFLLLSIQIIDF